MATNKNTKTPISGQRTERPENAGCRAWRNLPQNEELSALPFGTLLSINDLGIGSKGRTRTYNHTVNSRVLYH